MLFTVSQWHAIGPLDGGCVREVFEPAGFRSLSGLADPYVAATHHTASHECGSCEPTES